ncbi:MAG: pitrilysin family protein [Nitrospirota bacterium]
MKNSKYKKILIISLILNFTFLILNLNYVSALEAKRTVLPNGLIVLHSENHNLPLVMVTLLIKASQINEPEDKAGLANLTAELLTEGTEKRKSADISEEIEFIGASLDASADRDYTVVALSILKKDVNKGFEILSDILLNSIFPEEEIKRKKELIKGFLKQKEEDPSFLAGREFKKALFGRHPYARLIEGCLDTIDNIKREDLVGFYSDYFLPNNSILSVAGDLTFEELDTLIKKYLGDWKMAEISKRSKEWVPNESRTKKVIKIDKDLTQANIILGNVGISRDNPDYYAVSVMNYIFGGGGFSSRLMRSIRDEMGLAYDVHSFFTANKETGFFAVEVQTKNESAKLVISEILKQVERIRKEHVSDEELSDAKSYLTGSFARRLDTNRKIADFLASVEFYNIGIDYMERYPEYINFLTKDDILRVALKYLDSENYVIVVVANQEKATLKY